MAFQMKTLIAAGAFLLPGLALAGAVDSGGTDQYAADHGAAWFLGGKPIHYCFAVDPGFGTELVHARTSLQAAAGTWNQYIERRQVNRARPAAGTLGLKLIERTSCDGQEDLKIYLGAVDSPVAAAKAKYDNPIAIAERTNYDMKAGWGKGFIWLRNPGPGSHGGLDWSKPATLEGAFLHELGHVLGCEHVGGTIMDDRTLASNLLWRTEHNAPASAERRRRTLTLIDGKRSLFNAFEFGIIMGSIDASDRKETFERFVGKSPKGEIRARAWLDMPTVNEPKFATFVVELADDDASSTVRLPISTGKGSTQMKTLAEVFKVALEYTDESGTQVSTSGGFGDMTIAGLTQARARSGENYPAMVSMNGKRQLEVVYLIENRGVNLFKSKDSDSER